MQMLYPTIYNKLIHIVFIYLYTVYKYGFTHLYMYV